MDRDNLVEGPFALRPTWEKETAVRQGNLRVGGDIEVRVEKACLPDPGRLRPGNLNSSGRRERVMRDSCVSLSIK